MGTFFSALPVGSEFFYRVCCELFSGSGLCGFGLGLEFGLEALDGAVGRDIQGLAGLRGKVDDLGLIEVDGLGEIEEGGETLGLSQLRHNLVHFLLDGSGELFCCC